MQPEVASALVDAYWQATLISIVVVGLSIAAFSLLSFWSVRHIDAKFAAQDAKQDAREVRLQDAIDRGTKEHEDWRKEMRAINEKLTEAGDRAPRRPAATTTATLALLARLVSRPTLGAWRTESPFECRMLRALTSTALPRDETNDNVSDY